MTKKYDVYALGNALVDTEIEVSDAFLERMEVGKGLMTLVDEARQTELLTALKDEAEPRKQTSGGSACNTVIATRYFGGSGYYACKVADDATGDIFVNDLTAAGVDTNMNSHRENGISGKCLVMLTPDAERTMNTFLGISSQVSESELDEAAIADSQYVYLEGYLVSGDSSRAATVKLRQLAEKHGVKTSLTFSDPAMVQFFKDGLTEMLGDGVDLLFCNGRSHQPYRYRQRGRRSGVTDPVPLSGNYGAEGASMGWHNHPHHRPGRGKGRGQQRGGRHVCWRLPLCHHPRPRLRHSRQTGLCRLGTTGQRVRPAPARRSAPGNPQGGSRRIIVGRKSASADLRHPVQ